MDWLVRKTKGALQDPGRAWRIIYNETAQRVRVATRYLFRQACIFEVGTALVVFPTPDWYSKLWFFPRCDHGHYHEPAVTRLFLERLPSARSFVDVGAHLGYFSGIAAAAMPDLPVLAYEMDDRAYARLARNMVANRFLNVHTYHQAIAPERGVVHYHRPTFLDSGESLAQSGVAVEGLTLDDVFREHSLVPGIIKIDVEGAEYGVLKGADETLRRGATLLLEIHGNKLRAFGSNSQQVIKLLEDAGYRVSEIPDHRRTTGSELVPLSSYDAPFDRNVMTLVTRI